MQQLVGITRIERKLGDSAVVNHSSKLCAGGIHERSFRGNFYSFLCSSHLEGRIQRDHAVDLNRDALLHILFEARLLKLDCIVTRHNLQKIEIAAGIRLGFAGNACRIIRQTNGDVCQHRATGIGYASQDSATCTLSKQ